MSLFEQNLQNLLFYGVHVQQAYIFVVVLSGLLFNFSSFFFLLEIYCVPLVSSVVFLFIWIVSHIFYNIRLCHNLGDTIRVWTQSNLHTYAVIFGIYNILFQKTTRLHLKKLTSRYIFTRHLLVTKLPIFGFESIVKVNLEISTERSKYGKLYFN